MLPEVMKLGRAIIWQGYRTPLTGADSKKQLGEHFRQVPVRSRSQWWMEPMHVGLK
jgi:hypothetical protein